MQRAQSRRAADLLGPLTAALAIAALAGTVRAADIPPQTKSGSNVVTVRGCLHGMALVTLDDSEQDGLLLAHQRVDLAADKATTQLLKKQNGHVVEVIGDLKTPNTSGTTITKEKKIAGGRVYVGATQTPTTLTSPIATPRIDVRELLHAGDRCS